MHTLLGRYGITTTSVNRAVQTVNTMSNSMIDAMVNELGLVVAPGDAHRVAKCIIHALMSGAVDKDAVVNFVYKRVPKLEVEVQTAPVVIDSVHGVSVISSGGIVATSAPLGVAAPITGRLGRSKLGNSAFSRAVALLEDSQHLSRAGKLDLLVSADIKKSSAVVYLWRYNNGERE